MKKIPVMTCILCLVILLSAGAALAAESGYAADTAELLPVDMISYTDRAEIRKVYELSPTENPGRLPRDVFERSGYKYECADILREVVIGTEYKTVTVTETAESTKNDMDTVLALFPQFIDYSDEDGYSGTLLLNTATIKSEISGYGSYSTPYTVSRSYPNLSDADTNYIPKTIEDNGRTLQLQNIEWRTDNTYNVDDYEIGNRYTATVTYEGARTTSYISGYDLTANYSGEASRRGVSVIRYTVIFIGTEIQVATPEPAIEPPEALKPLPETVAEPEAVSVPDPQPEPAAKSGGILCWLPILLSALALAGSGVCIPLSLKKRKEPPRHEETSNYIYPDSNPYPIDTDSSPGFGNGEF